MLNTFFFSAFFVGSYAQECGKVIDLQTTEPIIGAHIYLDDEELVAVTDMEGQFCLPASVKVKRNTLISFSHIGYEKTELSWKQFRDNGSIALLKPAPHALDEVTVSGRELYYRLPYKTLAPLKTAISSFGSVQVGNYIYIIGGDVSYKESAIAGAGAYFSGKPSFATPVYDGYSSSMYRYDVQNDKWEKLPYRFRNRAFHKLCHYDNKLYVVGGKRLSANRRLEYLDHTVEIFDLQRDTILVDPVNPHQAIDFASCVYDGNLILLGGAVKQSRSGKKTYTNKVHAFDPRKGYWYEMVSLPEAREAEGIRVGDKLYLIGGLSKDREQRRIQSYSLTEGTVTHEATLAYEVRRPALAVHGDVIYIFEDGIMQTYNVNTNERQSYEVDLYMRECEMFCADGKLFLIGGKFGDIEYGDSYQPSKGLYCIELNEFENTRLYTSR
ncbi:MAG: carboxypeptidase-like regulatory domain-containing protein [Bacteroides sp.]|nr:carboxypeptidase-like regulatory domain-containing protein [Bacteroides sp.]